MKRILILMMLAIFAAQSPALFAVPQLINYQGYLTRPGGTPLDTTVAMAFTLYASPSDNDTFWTETHPTVSVTNGLFHVLLGSVSPLNNVFSTDRWLGIAVGNNMEMTPRQQVVSVAYSYRVGTVDGAAGGNIGGKLNVGSGNTNTGLAANVFGESNSAAGALSVIAGGDSNATVSPNAVIGGGRANTAGNTGPQYTEYATVGGGWHNAATYFAATVGGGKFNTASGGSSTIAGGSDNSSTGGSATVGGGFQNTASGWRSVVSGGYQNYAAGDYSTAGGGFNNQANGPHATVPGGLNNRAAANCSFAAGDSTNAVGRNSFTLGTRITCAAESAFVWSDGSGPVLSIGSSNTFNVKATGGTRIWSNSDLTAGVRLNAGANAWTSVSDSTKKRDIRLTDTRTVLNKIAALPIKDWEYKSEQEGTRHIGPMAQDFWNAFHLGNEPLGISTIDADGISMAAIQALYKELVELRARVQTLEAEKQNALKEK